MTLYVTFRAIEAGQMRLDTEVTYSARAGAEPPSKMGFQPGTKMRLDDALRMMMVKSANDIAVEVAEAVGGSVTAFAARMNEEAKRLGMTRSHWVNPNGLPDPSQRTTARDMALLARALLTEFPQYRDYYRIPAIAIGGKILKNYNQLLEHYPGATGMKTGFVCASGYNLVASAKRGDREVLAVVFGAYGGKARTLRAAELLDQGFASAVPANSDMVPSGAATAPTTPPVTHSAAASAKAAATGAVAMTGSPSIVGAAAAPPSTGTAANGAATAAAAPLAPVAAPLTTIAEAKSGESYQAPIDMRAYVCGPRRAIAASESNEDDAEIAEVDEATHLTILPIYLGPPVAVAAYAPTPVFEPGNTEFMARMPKPRPARDGETGDVMNALMPEDTGAETPSAAAIGTAAGSPKPLGAVAPAQ
jgi:D-alanyl-D-alanine carboxypeptidase